MKGAKQSRQLLYGSQITTSYGYDPLDRLLLLSKLSLRFVYQLQDFLRPAAQQESFIGKDNFTGAPVEKSYPHLLLHLRHLSAQSGLSDMQHLRGFGDTLLPDHGQKIS